MKPTRKHDLGMVSVPCTAGGVREVRRGRRVDGSSGVQGLVTLRRLGPRRRCPQHHRAVSCICARPGVTSNTPEVVPRTAVEARAFLGALVALGLLAGAAARQGGLRPDAAHPSGECISGADVSRDLRFRPGRRRFRRRSAGAPRAERRRRLTPSERRLVHCRSPRTSRFPRFGVARIPHARPPQSLPGFRLLLGQAHRMEVEERRLPRLLQGRQRERLTSLLQVLQG